jgi:hypothetical protein
MSQAGAAPDWRFTFQSISPKPRLQRHAREIELRFGITGILANAVSREKTGSTIARRSGTTLRNSIPGHKSLKGDLPMGYLPDPKTTTIFVTASSISINGRKRKIIVETRPEFAIVQLHGSKERYSLAWETIFETATKLDATNRNLEQKTNSSVSNSGRLIGSENDEPDVGLPAKKPAAAVRIKRLKFA